LEKQPERRFQTASDLAFALEALRAASGAELTTQKAMHAATGALKSLPPRALAAILAVLLVAAYIGSSWGLSWWPFQQTVHQPLAEARPWFEIGTQALRNGSYYQASEYLETALQKDPQFALARARLAEALAEQDYSDEAQRQLILVSTLVPDRSKLAAFDRLTLEAILNAATRNLTAAINNYMSMVGLAPESEKAHVYLDLGRAYEKNDEPAKAIENYQRALETDPQSATAYLRLGIIYGQRQKDLTRADASFSAAEDLYESGRNKEGLAEVYFNRGMVYDALNRLDEACSQLQRAVDTGNDNQKIRAIFQLSGNSVSAGKFEQAEQEAREGLRLAQRSDMKNLFTRGYISLAYVCHSRGDYDKAISHYNQAIESARVYSGRKDMAFAQVNLGGLLIQQGRIDDGLREVEAAQSFFHSADYPDYRSEELQALIIIARARRKQGDYEAAQSAYEKLLPLAEKSGDQSLVALVHSEAGRLLIYQERYPEAIPRIDEYYRINQSLGLKPKVGYALLNRAFVMFQLGDYKSARDALSEVTSFADRAAESDKQLLADVSLLESQIALSRQSFKLAAQKGLETANRAEAQFPEISIAALQTLGLAETFSGSVRAGLQRCHQAMGKAERQSNERLLADARLALAQSKAIAGGRQESLNLAKQAQESFSRQGRIESEWRAWLVVADFYGSLKQAAQARDAALKASEKLARLQRQWGADNYDRYLTRPDIRSQHARLRELLSQ
jgi:tetratricopeptide (TPR) repeat protein